jgi:hypothetical protein
MQTSAEHGANRKILLHKRCKLGAHRFRPGAAAAAGSIMIDASTSMLFLRRLPPNEAWMLVFRDSDGPGVTVLISLRYVQPGCACRQGLPVRPGASALSRYMWYACRYELRAPMMGLTGSLIRLPKCTLSQGLSLRQPAARRLPVTARGSKVGPGLTTLRESSWHAHRRAAISVTPIPLSLNPVRID